MGVIRSRATVALAALAIDAALGELPNRYHPVARFGQAAGRLERATASAPAPVAGFAVLGASLGAALASAAAVRRLCGIGPTAFRILVEAIALKQAFAFRSLLEHARAVEAPLNAGDLAAAREAVGRMVSRPTGDLDEPLVASAALESVSENYSDSVVAPLAWYVAGGLSAAFAYRVVNTLDAMVGYHSNGWVGAPSARADDALNFVPARATAALLSVATLSPRRAWAGTLLDHGATPSPNSGWPMAAMAHGLGVRLEKPGHHVLNAEGRAPNSWDVARSRWVTLRVTLAIAALLALVAWKARR